MAREVGTEGKLGGQAQVHGRVRHLARPHRQRQLHGVEPDRAGPQHRPGRHGGGEGRPVAEDHGRRAGRDPGAQGHREHDGRPAVRRSPTRSPGWPARSVPRASSAVRRRSRASSGTWRDLTDNVNSMASNLTGQVRNIAQVTTAVAKGDLSQKITVDAQGEILELKNTVNTMVDQLLVVRRRGHPGGPRGRHRGQARRPGQGARRLRHVAGPDRERQPARVDADHPAARDRRRSPPR